MSLAGALKIMADGESCRAVADGFGQKDITTKDMQAAIQSWFTLYFESKPTEISDPCQRIAYTVVNKMYKAAFAEYDSSITDKDKSKKAQWQDKNRRNLDALRKQIVQLACIGGTCLIKPVPIAGMWNAFNFQVIRRDRYVVFARNSSGVITDIGMIEASAFGGKHYKLLERRTVDADGYLSVKYKLFESDYAEHLGRLVPLAALPCYESLPTEIDYNMHIGGVGLIAVCTPMINCVDGSADAVSIYAPAAGLIQNININEKQLNDEFELGKMRIAVAEQMLDRAGPSGLRRLKDKIFTGLEGLGNSITAFNPQLRNESYEERKQSYLRSVESICGLKRGILSNVEAVERTKKEITSSEGDYSLSINDLENMWFDALRDTLRLCDRLGQSFKMCDNSAWDSSLLSVSWGNGVLYDPDADWAETLTMVQREMLKPEIALAWKYDLPWETENDLAEIRKKYMPEIIDALSPDNMR